MDFCVPQDGSLEEALPLIFNQPFKVSATDVKLLREFLNMAAEKYGVEVLDQINIRLPPTAL